MNSLRYRCELFTNKDIDRRGSWSFSIHFPRRFGTVSCAASFDPVHFSLPPRFFSSSVFFSFFFFVPVPSAVRRIFIRCPLPGFLDRSIQDNSDQGRFLPVFRSFYRVVCMIVRVFFLFFCTFTASADLFKLAQSVLRSVFLLWIAFLLAELLFFISTTCSLDRSSSQSDCRRFKSDARFGGACHRSPRGSTEFY